MTAREILNELLAELPAELRNLRPLQITPTLDGSVFSVYLAYGLDETGGDGEDRHEFEVDLMQPDSLKMMKEWLITTLSTISCS